MEKKQYRFASGSTVCYFNGRFTHLKQWLDPRHTVVVTDTNVHALHEPLFRKWKTIVIPAGEEFKNQETVDSIIHQLIALEADRKTTLVGVGGGVVTDITGYAAAVYMRGISCGFVPTTLLALVDAAIGGKNGIDVGSYKNLVGTIRQPAFLLHDMNLLNTLPHMEWINGFAEIIKHACIRDAAMFNELEKHDITYYQKNKKQLAILVRRNAEIKIRVVQRDENEKNERRLLNFGHTLGHAIENEYRLLHGQAVAVGMAYAATISEKLTGFNAKERLLRLLERYSLPCDHPFDRSTVFANMKMDKKRERKDMNYILLEKIGKGIVKPIPVKQLEKLIKEVKW